ncbi:MAG: sulfatase-like hydrolase/transferase [Candidatus Binatia bacterium]|nr:sulfatase-like hydrolase/transferase [Candidatus Binatia bacterium]MDG2010007.1 sulfatase-like hydrolase/transferase [Candidatus Binatia bacterium]
MRCLGWILCAFGLLCVPALAQAAKPQENPNIILIISDDHGWPYYGFMQRYLRERLNRGEFRIDPTRFREGYDHPEIVIPEDIVSSSPTQDCGVDQPGCQPCRDGDCTPPIHRILTPSIDRLAEDGSYFPAAHTGAVVCKPSMASILTGLHNGDYQSVRGKILTPTLPEWLPGFSEEQGIRDPTTYLTMAGGKWAYGKTFVDRRFRRKKPFDRDYPRGNPEAATRNREILSPRRGADGIPFERAMDFIDCATCADASKCILPATERRADPDSSRMAPRVDSCTAQPFFLVIGPSIPHQNIRLPKYCPIFPRDEVQCGKEPYKSHSAYCHYRPELDRNDDGVLTGDEYLVCEGLIPGYRQIASNIAAEGDRFREASGLDRNVAYLSWISVLDRAVDELYVQLAARGELENTIIMLITDNGFNTANNSKKHFSANGMQSPIVMFDGRNQNAGQNCGPNLPGCQSRFAHAVDLLATMREVSGTATQTCPPPGVDCVNCCPDSRPDQKSRYEGITLTNREPRPCDIPAHFSPNEKQIFRQCMIGRKHGSGQTTNPGKQWYLLAEVEDPSTSTGNHLCKLYRRDCAGFHELFDLNSDPSERNELFHEADTVCGAVAPKMKEMLALSMDQKGWNDCLAGEKHNAPL